MADKVALVTGASSGIGFALAEELATREYDLIVCAEDESLGDAAEELSGYGVEVQDVQADLSTEEGVRKLWSEVKAGSKAIEIACLNAGVRVGGPFKGSRLDDQINLVELNCTRTVELAKFVVQDMVARGEGKILFTSSIAGDMLTPGRPVYAATEAFDISFAHRLHHELENTGVTVTALQPGPAETDFYRGAAMEISAVDQYGKKPDEVARQGVKALMAGKDHVYSASFKIRIEDLLASFIPGRSKATMH